MRHTPVASLLLICVTVIGVDCHDWGWGACPRVDPQPNLSLDKFLGMWYVIEQFNTDSICYVFNYTRVSDTQLKVTKGRQWDVLHRAGVPHTTAYTGSLDIPSDKDVGRLRVKWPANIMGKGDYIIVSTDYVTYGGIYDCQPITALAHRQSAAILSRTPDLDQMYIDKVKRRLLSFGIDDHDFDKIDHSNCVSPSDKTYNVKLDENTFKNIWNGAVEGAKTIGSKVANTTATLYHEGRRRLGYGEVSRTLIHDNYHDPDAEVFV